MSAASGPASAAAGGPGEEHRLVRETFARFSDQRVAPQAEALDLAHQYPRALIGELGALGLFGLRYPQADGGSGMDATALCIALEEIARGSLSVAACAAMQALMGTHFLHALGGPELHERLLAPALRGERIGALCMTEPDAGSDLGAIATRARKVEGGYLLSGRKTWVTAAPVADFFTVFARTGEDGGLTIFLVERDFAGLTIGREIAKMGVWALPTSELALEECRVPDSHRLSAEEGDGEAQLRAILAEIRIVTAALAIGVARAALAAALAYGAERRQFGRPINRFQAIQHKLAEMATELEAARLLTYHAAALPAAGGERARAAAMAKLFASEAAVAICDKAARVLASYGYAMDYPVQRYLRDVRFTLIGGGTSEILKQIIARSL